MTQAFKKYLLYSKFWFDTYLQEPSSTSLPTRDSQQNMLTYPRCDHYTYLSTFLIIYSMALPEMTKTHQNSPLSLLIEAQDAVCIRRSLIHFPSMWGKLPAVKKSQQIIRILSIPGYFLDVLHCRRWSGWHLHRHLWAQLPFPAVPVWWRHNCTYLSSLPDLPSFNAL